MSRPVVPAIAAALLGLAACSGDFPAPTPRPPEASAVMPLPPAGTPLRFVGRWATEARLCGTPAEWVFSPGGFAAPGGPACSFTALGALGGGYVTGASCTGPGVRPETIIRITFAESAQAMLVEEAPTTWSSGLVYCGPSGPVG